MAPKKLEFVLQRLSPPARVGLVDQAGGEVGVDRHLLARHGVEVEARRDLGDAAGALGDHHEIHDHQNREHDDADHEVAAHHEVAERLDHVAGGGGALVPARQDQARRGEIEREPQHGGDEQHGRERGKLERRLDEQRRHQDQHREDDRERERHVEKRGRQRQQQHHQDRHHADCERDVAAPKHHTDVIELRQGKALSAACYVTHRVCRCPPRPILGMKRARRGREAARPRQRNRARVQGPPPVRQVKGSMLTPAKFACLMVSGRLTRRPDGQKSLKHRLVLQKSGHAARRAWSRRARAIGAAERGTLLRRPARGSAISCSAAARCRPRGSRRSTGTRSGSSPWRRRPWRPRS